jgi:HSP20 family molecular chaperone IbpA
MYGKRKCRPVIRTVNGREIFQWIFDVCDFSPEDLTVKAVDGKVQVEAKILQESEHFRYYLKASRFITLPKGEDLQEMTSAVFDNGWLTINVLYKGPAKDSDGFTPIPVQHEPSNDQRQRYSCFLL